MTNVATKKRITPKQSYFQTRVHACRANLDRLKPQLAKFESMQRVNDTEAIRTKLQEIRTEIRRWEKDLARYLPNARF